MYLCTVTKWLKWLKTSKDNLEGLKRRFVLASSATAESHHNSFYIRIWIITVLIDSYQWQSQPSPSPINGWQLFFQHVCDRAGQIRGGEHWTLTGRTLVSRWSRMARLLSCKIIETRPVKHICGRMEKKQTKKQHVYIIQRSLGCICKIWGWRGCPFTRLLWRRKYNNRTVANQSDSVLRRQRGLAQSTVRVVIAVLKPLQIWLHYTLEGQKTQNFNVITMCDKNVASVYTNSVILTLLWLETRQCSQTFTRCSKQNKLVTFLFGHLHRPMATCSIWMISKSQAGSEQCTEWGEHIDRHYKNVSHYGLMCICS